MAILAQLPVLALLVGGVYSQTVSHAGYEFMFVVHNNQWLLTWIMIRVNLFGLANDMSIFGSAYSAFEGTNCNASYEVYPYFNSVENFEVWHEKGFNMFRLAMGWQHVQTELGGPLNETTMSAVDELVTHITSNDSVAILDIVSIVLISLYLQR